MTEPLRWGILGAANFALRHMGPAINEAEGATLAAVASRSPERAAPFRAFAPGVRVHGDYDALLADDDVDAVYVPLPNHLHVEWGLKALEAGKHVLVEKPATMAAREFDDLIAARDRAGRLASEGYMIVHHPQWQLTRQLVQGGAIGDLCHIQGSFAFDNSAETDNIRNRAETGGGALRDIGVYPFGAARFVTGSEPEDVKADVTFEDAIDTTSCVRASFPGAGFSGASFAAYLSIRMAQRQEMVFHGRTGTVRLTAPFNAGVSSEAQVHVARNGHPEELYRFPTVRQYKLQVEAFCRAARSGGDWPVPLEWSRGTQVMIDAILG